jgi:hypothetical protein
MMLPLRHSALWRIAGWGLLAIVFALTLVPPTWLWPQDLGVSGWLPASDKWAHGVTFAALAAWFCGQYAAKRDLLRIGIALVVFGAFIEFCQGLIGYRSMEWLDFVADAAGVVVGIMVAGRWFAGWSADVESWWYRRPQRGSLD